jgi:hypothetical protein
MKHAQVGPIEEESTLSHLVHRLVGGVGEPGVDAAWLVQDR